MEPTSRIEDGLERALFASRWLLAPIYAGLVAVLLMLVVVFVRQILAYLPKALELTPEGAILAALSLIDLALAANLVVIVIFSGYESFVSRFSPQSAGRLDWMGTVDFSGLKIKLVASIVAISGIHLLKRFMEIGTTGPVGPEEARELGWLTGIHFVFVLSGVLLALMDWLGAKSGRKGVKGEGPGG